MSHHQTEKDREHDYLREQLRGEIMTEHERTTFPLYAHPEHALPDPLDSWLDEPLARFHWHYEAGDEHAGIRDFGGYVLAEDQTGTILGALREIIEHLDDHPFEQPAPSAHGLSHGRTKYAAILLLSEARRSLELADIAYRHAYPDRAEIGAATIREARSRTDRALAGLRSRINTERENAKRRNHR